MSLAFMESPATRDPLAGFDLETLTRGAARLRPDRLAVRDSSGASATFAELDRRADAMASRLAELGLTPGETLMVAGGARVSTCIGLLAGLRAGLDVALAPLHPTATGLAAYAARAGARAVATQTGYGDLAPIEDMFEVAARAPDVRLVCSLGPTPFDGAVDLDIARGAVGTRISLSGHAPRIATFAPGGGVVFHQQRTLVAAALDLAGRARIGMGASILSTIAPVSFAGLVAGPFLSMLAGASLHLHGPFATIEFLTTLEALDSAHVIVPGAMAGSIAEAGLIDPCHMAALLLLDRTSEARGALAPLGDARGVAIIDLHAFAEEALIAEVRGADGRPLPAAREPHMIPIDDTTILAVRRREGSGPLAFEGEAVSASQ
jgi:hypothetical protein